MPEYQHHWKDGTPIHFPLGKIVCVGRNYAAHAEELNNPIPETPLLFIKPASSAMYITRPLSPPRDRGAVHFETELAVLIGQPLSAATATQARDAILGYGLALDLTLRDVQSELKTKGHPWERAKAFDGACPLSPFISAQGLSPETLHFTLDINGERRQTGDTGDMLNPVVPLIQHISQIFSLQPGDVILTGTPAGVGALESGHTLSLSLLPDPERDPALFVETTVV